MRTHAHYENVNLISKQNVQKWAPSLSSQFKVDLEIERDTSGLLSKNVFQ